MAMGALLWIGVLIFPLGTISLFVWVFPHLESSSPAAYSYMRDWQTGIGALVGFMGLMFVEAVRVTAEHRRRSRSASIAFLWEIVELQQRLTLSCDNLLLAYPSLGDQQKSSNPEEAPPFGDLLFRRIRLPDPDLVANLAGSVGVVPSKARKAIVMFYGRYRAAQQDIVTLLEPLVGEPVENAFVAAVY